MAFRGDGIGFLTGNPFWRFDITAPSSSQIVPSLSPSMNGFAFNRADTLYGLSGLRLFTIDQGTGATTLIGSTGIPGGGGLAGLAFTSGNALFAASPVGATSTLFRLNAATGAATQVGSIGIANVSGLTFANPGVVIADSGGATNVAEGGATDTYAVSLLTAPTANVTITINPGTQLTASPTTLTFTPANWNTPQTVTVTAVDDTANESNHTGTITHTTASSDANYSAIFVYSLTANITDNDQPPPGVNITQSGGSTAVAEGGATDTYTVVLNSQPSANVTVNINAGTQLTTAPTSLTFTSTNWNTPQTVTVTAVDDNNVEGAHSGVISHTATSTDASYNNITIASITAAITDNDFPPGVFITQSGGNTKVTEGGAGDSYTIVLGSRPTANVTITLNPGTQLTATPATLTFTSTNWNTPQTVAVTAVDDTLIEANPHTGTIAHTAASTDTNYNNFAIANVVVTIAENDFPPPDAPDTSEVAANMGALSGPKTFKGLDTLRQPGGKFDDDWYFWTMGKSGTFTVNLQNITVVASGPKGQGKAGDLAMRLYRVVNGNLIEIASSQPSLTKTLSVQVAAGERIHVWVYGIYYTQAQYDLAVDLN